MRARFSLLMLIAVVFIGCSSDSDSNSLPINEENLLGKWYFKGLKIDNRAFEPYGNDCPTSKDYHEILSNHTLKYYVHGTDCEVSHIGSATWALDGNNYTTINDDPIVVAGNFYKILSLTEEQLVLSIDTHPVSPTETVVYKYYYTRD